jgi:hypothetical protein
MNIAIIGFAETNRLAPFHDPEWQTWGLGDDPRAALLDKVFQMHTDDGPGVTPDLVRQFQFQRKEYADKIVTQDNYPFEEVEKVWPFGWDSSIAYVATLAILENPKRVGFWGVNMSSQSEYAHQRDNMMQILGFMRGRGIELVFAPGSHIDLPKRKYPFFEMKPVEPIRTRLSNSVLIRA